MASSESDLNACIDLLQRQIDSLVQNVDYKRDALESLQLMGVHKSVEFKLLSSVQKLLLFLNNSKAKSKQQQQVNKVKNLLIEFKTHINQIDTEKLSQLTKTTQLQYLLEFTFFIDTIHQYQVLTELTEKIIDLQPSETCRNAIRFLIKPDEEENPFARVIKALKSDAADVTQLVDASTQLISFNQLPLPIFIKKTLTFQLMNEVFNHLKHSPQSSILPVIRAFLAHQNYVLEPDLSNLFNLYAKAVSEIQAFYNTVCSHPNENILIDKEALSLAQNFLLYYADSTKAERLKMTSKVMKVELLYKSALYLVDQHQINKTWHHQGRQTLELTHLVFQLPIPGYGGDVQQHFLKCIPHLLPAFLSFGMVDAFQDMANQAIQLFPHTPAIEAVNQGYHFINLFDKTFLKLISQQHITLAPVDGPFFANCLYYCYNLFLLALINNNQQGTGKLLLIMYQQNIQKNRNLKKYASTFFNTLNSIIEIFSLIEYVNSLQDSQTAEEEIFALKHIEEILNKNQPPQIKQYRSFTKKNLERLFTQLKDTLTQHATILDKPSTVSMRRHRALIQYSTQITKHLHLLNPTKQQSITKHFNSLFKIQQYNKQTLALFDGAAKAASSSSRRAKNSPNKHQLTRKGKTKSKREQLVLLEKQRQKKQLEQEKKSLKIKQQTIQDKSAACALPPLALYKDIESSISSAAIRTVAITSSEPSPTPTVAAAASTKTKLTQGKQKKHRRLKRKQQRARQKQNKRPIRLEKPKLSPYPAAPTGSTTPSPAATSQTSASQASPSQAGLFKQSPKPIIAVELMPQALIIIATELHNRSKQPVFLTGGAIEALWLGNKAINDYDCIIPDCISLAKVSQLVEQIKSTSPNEIIQNLSYYIEGPIGFQTLTITLTEEDSSQLAIDISLFTYDKENPNKSLDNNAKKRDIVSSCMYIDLTGEQFEIYDPLLGLAALGRKEIEIHPHNPGLFSQDPLRLLRIVKAMLKRPDFTLGKHLTLTLSQLDQAKLWQHYLTNTPSLISLHNKLMHLLERFNSVTKLLNVMQTLGLISSLFGIKVESSNDLATYINSLFAKYSDGIKAKQRELFFSALTHTRCYQQIQADSQPDLSQWPLYRVLEQAYPESQSNFAAIADHYQNLAQQREQHWPKLSP